MTTCFIKKENHRLKVRSCAFFVASFFVTEIFWAQGSSQPLAPQKRVMQSAEALLETAEVSYVYGGARLGSERECISCNQCLEDKKPGPKTRLALCPQCHNCSLDCSHFTQLVFRNANLYAPYLDTKTMLTLDPATLLRRYQLVHIANGISDKALPGDLLVYDGHVVLLTNKIDAKRGDIVHATGGKDIKDPGQGIQRERNVPLEVFRGPLLRVLRHRDLVMTSSNKLRPVLKK